MHVWKNWQILYSKLNIIEVSYTFHFICVCILPSLDLMWWRVLCLASSVCVYLIAICRVLEVLAAVFATDKVFGYFMFLSYARIEYLHVVGWDEDSWGPIGDYNKSPHIGVVFFQQVFVKAKTFIVKTRQTCSQAIAFFFVKNDQWLY